MGFSYARYAPYAFFLCIATIGILAIFSLFNSEAKGQYLNAKLEKNPVPAEIKNVRFGIHPNKVRIVIDINHPTDLRYRLSDDQKAFRLFLPSASFKTSWLPQKYLSRYIYEIIHSEIDQGSEFIIKSKIPVNIERPFFLSPSGRRGYRIVVDVTPSKTPNLNSKSMTLVASIDNTGAMPGKNIEISELSYSQNPYIQRAFPRKNIQSAPSRSRRQSTSPRIRHNKPQNAYPVRSVKPPLRRNRFPAQPIKQPGKIGQSAEMQQIGELKRYAKGSLAMQMIDEITGDGNGLFDTEYYPGFLMSAAVGAKLDNGFRVEGELFYANSGLKKFSGNWNGSFYNTEEVKGDISTTALMGNLFYDFPSQYPLVPYAMAGVGFTLLSLNDFVVKNTAMANDMDLVAAMQVGAGFSFDIDRRTKLDIGYRYLETQDPEFSDSTGTPFESTFASHNFLVGARINLN